MSEIKSKKSSKDLFFIWNSIAMFFMMSLGWTFRKYINIEYNSTMLTILRSLTILILFLLFFVSYKISIKELNNMIYNRK